MRKRSRVQRVLKWGGTLFCLLALLWVYLAGVFYPLGGGLGFKAKSGSWCLYLQSGGAYALVCDTALPAIGPGIARPFGGRGWASLFSWPSIRVLSGVPPGAPGLARTVEVALSMWLFILPAALLAIFFWRQDSRIPQGHCQTCGYDLTGNVSGVCPECGERV